MNRFHEAVSFVARELDRYRADGYALPRASTAALERLRAASARGGLEMAAPASVAVRETALHVVPETVPVVEAPAAAPMEIVDSPVLTDRALSKAERMEQLKKTVLPCVKCPHLASTRKQVVFGAGSVDGELMFVGEAPGADEDAEGEPFVGRAGQLLTKMIQTMGFQRDDVFIANVLKCRPDTPGQAYGNRPPTPHEMATCRPYIFEQIDIIQPRVIVALGASAVRGLLDIAAPMREVRGRWHEFRDIPVMPTYHPSYLMRNQSLGEKRKVWEDMLQVKERLGHAISERDRNYFLPKA